MPSPDAWLSVVVSLAAPEVLEALELVTRFVGTVRAEVLGTTLSPDGDEA
jgi:hypothetical protein